MRKLSIFVSLLLASSTIVIAQANAAPTTQISFVMMNPLTNLNVGAGIQVIIYPINHPQERTDLRTDSNGVVNFALNQEPYGLDWYCVACNAPLRQNGATAYLIQPKIDGKFEVLSMADQPVLQNSNGAWILTSEVRIPATSDSPWKLMASHPDFNGSPRLMFLLTNGKVLIQTGADISSRQKWWLLTPDKDGNYDTGKWEQAPSPKDYNPMTYNGAVLHNGNVMIFGGEQNASDDGVVTQNTNICQIYDVETNSWHKIAPPNNGEGHWTALLGPNTILADGRVLIGALAPGTNANESILYDPPTDTWAVTGTNKVADNNEAGFTLLQNDKVLSVQAPYGPLGTGTSIAEIYDPATGLWSSAGETNALFNYTEIGPGLGLRNGNVLQTGSLGANGLYNPITNSWSVVPPLAKLKNGLQLIAQDNEAVILPNGNILTITATYIHSTIFGNGIAAGRSMAPSRYVEYDWRTNSWIDLPEDLLTLPSWSGPNMTFFLPLPNGQIMVADGGGIQFFTSTGSPEASWSPIVSSLSSRNLVPNTKYTISGKQLSGLTQGQQWGDEWEAATNYPLVRIVNNASHHVFYARTTNFSSTSIAPMTPSTFDFTIDSNFEDGPSKLYVVATGIESAAEDVTISGGYDKVAADKAIADKAAAELKAKQDAEAKAAADKAAAELKAKQDAEAKAAADKAAAELKVKQDAEAKAAADKAAAELKAKQDADKAAAELKAKQDADAKAVADKLAKAAVQKKTTITCIKGKSAKKITAIKPTCPAGYKKK